MNHSQRLRHVEGAPGAFDDGAVDELAAKGNRAVAAGVGFFEGLQDFLAVVDFGCRWAEDGIDRLDLRGMDAGHGGEAELARLLSKGEQPRGVVQIHPYAVDGLHVGCGGGDDDGGAGID